ncbi:MAG: hypothetical protein D6743_09065 [Calditrichaeota bacterium]|nr:MAG: hypothetical protein D6743_09065 [Calditrichota bacterium]
MILALLWGCRAGTKGEEDDFGQVRKRPKTTVHVENRNFYDMTIYVLSRGERVRLGLVRGLSDETFEIPEDLVLGAHTIRFLADPIGSGDRPVSQELNVEVGDELELVISN